MVGGLCAETAASANIDVPATAITSATTTRTQPQLFITTAIANATDIYQQPQQWALPR